MLSSRRSIVFLGVSTAFIALSFWAGTGGYLPGEVGLLTAIIHHRVPPLSLPAQLISALGSINVILPLWVIMMLVLLWRRQGLGVLTILPVPLGYPLYAALKSLITRPSPSPSDFPWIYDLSFGYYLESVLHSQLQTLPAAGVPVPVVQQSVTAQAVTRVIESGYPSGHALLAVIFYGGLALWWWISLPRGKVRWFASGTCLVLAICVGLVRMYMGLHYPSDILGSWLLGVLFVCVSYRVARAMAQKWSNSNRRGLSFRGT